MEEDGNGVHEGAYDSKMYGEKVIEVICCCNQCDAERAANAWVRWGLLEKA
jgi:hypothetical protein